MICNCIILARKNSRRIINKNLVNFKGKPLIYWTITKALKLKNIKALANPITGRHNKILVTPT